MKTPGTRDMEAVRSAAKPTPAELAGTGTRRDGEGETRDTDIGSSSPLQALAQPALCDAVPVETSTWPSLILSFAKPTFSDPAQADAMQTVTFEKSNGGNRDTDIGLFAAATQTRVEDSLARDADVEQLDYSAIGAKHPAVSPKAVQ